MALPLANDPSDLIVTPGVRVRDIETMEGRALAALLLEADISKILGQIANAEANPATVQPGWRTRAQGAIRWRKKARAAVISRADAMRAETAKASRAGLPEKRQAILDTIRSEVGDDEFERLVGIARLRHPDLGWGST